MRIGRSDRDKNPTKLTGSQSAVYGFEYGGIGMKKEKRFKVTFKDGGQLSEEGVRQILVDTETGVNYLVWNAGYAGGITPLLDSEGKVVVTNIDIER